MWADTLLILFISVCTALLGEGELFEGLKRRIAVILIFIYPDMNVTWDVKMCNVLAIGCLIPGTCFSPVRGSGLR
jgi:hypothetical protein